MTEKRFTIILDYDDEIGVKENRSGDVVVLNHRDLNSEQFVAQLIMFLNEQNDAIEKLIKDEKYWEQKAIKRITELEKENKELKEENIAIKKTLHTIINQIDVDKINNDKVVYSARILFKEKEFQFIYDIYKKSLEEL